jgi:hypothetical protein
LWLPVTLSPALRPKDWFQPPFTSVAGLEADGLVGVVAAHVGARAVADGQVVLGADVVAGVGADRLVVGAGDAGDAGAGADAQVGLGRVPGDGLGMAETHTRAERDGQPDQGCAARCALVFHASPLCCR